MRYGFNEIETMSPRILRPERPEDILVRLWKVRPELLRLCVLIRDLRSSRGQPLILSFGHHATLCPKGPGKGTAAPLPT